jgi:hypothetical protein
MLPAHVIKVSRANQGWNFGEMGFDFAEWWEFACVLYFKDPLFRISGLFLGNDL